MLKSQLFVASAQSSGIRRHFRGLRRPCQWLPHLALGHWAPRQGKALYIWSLGRPAVSVTSKLSENIVDFFYSLAYITSMHGCAVVAYQTSGQRDPRLFPFSHGGCRLALERHMM